MDCSEDCRMTYNEHVIHIQKEAFNQLIYKHKEYDTIFSTYGLSGILALIQNKFNKINKNDLNENDLNENDLNDILIDLQIYSILAIQHI